MPGSIAKVLDGGEPTPLSARNDETGSQLARSVDQIAVWEDQLIDEVWSSPHLTERERQELTEKIRVKAAEARAIQDRLRRSA